MKTSIKVFLAFFILCSQTTFANDILQEFLNKFSKLEYIEYKLMIETDLLTDRPEYLDTKCIEKVVASDTLTGFYYNYLGNNFQLIYNGKEFLEYEPYSFGENVVSYFTMKNHPEKFKQDTFLFNNEKHIIPPVYYSLTYLNYSIVNFANEIRTINNEKTTYKDTLVNGKKAVICNYIYQDTIIKGKRNFSIFRFVFDKSTKMPIYFTHLYYLPVTGKDGVNIHYLPVAYKDSSDIPKLIKISYLNSNLGKKDFKKYFTSKAFNKSYKIIEDAPHLVRKELLKVGELAPEWELKSLEGKKFQMKKSNDKIRFLVFTKIQCSHCMLAIPYLNDLHRNYSDIDVIAIYAKDKKDSVRKYQKLMKIEYPILPASSALTDLYHVNLYPTFFLVDKNGIIQFVQPGYGEGSKEKFKEAIEKLLK